jgi:hypothetical protein
MPFAPPVTITTFPLKSMPIFAPLFEEIYLVRIMERAYQWQLARPLG